MARSTSGASPLASTSSRSGLRLTQLTLSYNGRVGDEGARHIARLLRLTPSLTSLYVAWVFHSSFFLSPRAVRGCVRCVRWC
jgi:hypothetical protein